MLGGIFLSERNAEQAGGGINRVIVLLDFRFHSAFGLVLAGLAIASYDYNQILGFSTELFPDLGSRVGEILLQPLEIFEQFRAAPVSEQQLDVVAFFP